MKKLSRNDGMNIRYSYSGLDQRTVDAIEQNKDWIMWQIEGDIKRFPALNITDVVFTKRSGSEDWKIPSGKWDIYVIAGVKIVDECGLSYVIKDAITIDSEGKASLFNIIDKLRAFNKKVLDITDPVNKDEIVDSTIERFYSWMSNDKLSKYFQLYHMDEDVVESRIRRHLESMSDIALRKIKNDKNPFYVKTAGTLYLKGTRGDIPLFDYRIDSPDVSKEDRRAAQELRNSTTLWNPNKGRFGEWDTEF